MSPAAIELIVVWATKKCVLSTATKKFVVTIITVEDVVTELVGRWCPTARRIT